MQRNMEFAANGVQRARMKLTWAQVEVVTRGLDAVKVIVAGDDDSVGELRVEQVGDDIVVAQPQLGYAKEILPRTRWLEICLCLPEGWQGELDVDTISGMIGAHEIQCGDVSLSTVSGAMHLRGVSGARLSLHTVSGAVKGEGFAAERASLRTVSGRVNLLDARFGAAKAFTVSGEISVSLREGCRTLDSQSISGALVVEVEGAAKATMNSLSGQFVLAEEVKAADGCLEITASSVSGDLIVKGMA